MVFNFMANSRNVACVKSSEITDAADLELADTLISIGSAAFSVLPSTSVYVSRRVWF